MVVAAKLGGTALARPSRAGVIGITLDVQQASHQRAPQPATPAGDYSRTDLLNGIGKSGHQTAALTTAARGYSGARALVPRTAAGDHCRESETCADCDLSSALCSMPNIGLGHSSTARFADGCYRPGRHPAFDVPQTM
jgi:hypothetical protein